MNRYQHEGPWYEKEEVNEMSAEEPHDFGENVTWAGRGLLGRFSASERFVELGDHCALGRRFQASVSASRQIATVQLSGIIAPRPAAS
jgi:hypothetical protein